LGTLIVVAIVSADGLLPENWSRCYESPERV
jgi:hypothetical protein